MCAGKRHSAWPRKLWEKLGLEPPLASPAVTEDALAPWRTRFKALKTDVEDFTEDKNGPYG